MEFLKLPYEVLATIGIVFIILLLIVLFAIPTTRNSQRRKKERPPQQQKKETDWRGVSQKLERHITSVRKNLDESLQREKQYQEEILQLKQKKKQLEEKLQQEEGWLEKEQKTIDKKSEELGRLKEDLQKAEESIGREHSSRIFAERELRELKETFRDTDQKRKKAESDLAGLNIRLQQMDDELRELRRENRELKKKRDETTFIAKAEYDTVVKELKEKEKEYERLQREVKKESS